MFQDIARKDYCYYMLCVHVFKLCSLLIIFVIFCSLLVAIGIEAFNRLSQLKNEEKDINKKKSVVDQQPLVENKKEDQYSTASEVLSSHHVCICTQACMYYLQAYVCMQVPKRPLLTKLKSAASIAFGTTRVSVWVCNLSVNTCIMQYSYTKKYTHGCANDLAWPGWQSYFLLCLILQTDNQTIIPNDWTISSPSRASVIVTPSLPGSDSSAGRLSRLPQRVKSEDHRSISGVLVCTSNTCMYRVFPVWQFVMCTCICIHCNFRKRV